MKNLVVYLIFPGTCEAALNFYKDCLGGEILSLQRFSDTPGDGSGADYQDKVMHAQFKSEGIFLMASDTRPGDPVVSGNMVHLSLDLSDAQEPASVFQKLAAGGTVTMPLQETFWGAIFGTLTDQFGIHWMFNHDIPRPN